MRFKEYKLRNKNNMSCDECSNMVNFLNDVIKKGGSVIYTAHGWPYTDPGEVFLKKIFVLTMYFDRTRDKIPVICMVDNMGFPYNFNLKRATNQLKIFYKDNNDT